MSLKKDFYADLAKTLVGSIGNRTYCSSIIAGGEFDFRFSIVIYRDDNNKITDIVPVWCNIPNRKYILLPILSFHCSVSNR